MTEVTFGSVCSGIEAASVAWAPLGWRAAWLAEIEPYPCAVLAHYYPTTPNLGNMLLIPAMLRNGDIPAPDVFTGGTPCQAFSVAGLRASLKDARGNLSMTFCEIADEIDIQRAAAGLLPCVIKWENVPGVLTTKDNAFGCFLGGLAGESEALVPEPCPAAVKSSKFWKWNKKDGQHTLSWPKCGVVLGPQRAVAWRVLDAQYFGLAQRRLRVFVVASAREGFDPAAVLLEFDGVRRDSAPSRSPGQDAAAGTLRSTDGGSDIDHALAGHVQAVAYGYGGNCAQTDTARGLTAHPGGFRLDFETETFLVQPAPIVFDSRQECVSSTYMADDYKNGTFEECDTARPLTTSADRTRAAPIVCVTGDITHTLKAEGFDASEDGTGRGQPIVTAFSCKDYGADATTELAPTLRAMNHAESHANAGGQMAVQFGMAVRRLMPIECEKLQGFPPGYTLIPMGKKMAADGPRYKALGNSWAIPCVYWIGARIDKQLRQAEAKAAA